MTSLPQRPESPPRDRTDSRYSTDGRDRRQFPSISASRHYPDRNDRGYQRPRASDSYVPSSFDSRREPDARRRNYDDRDRGRDRGSWDRSRDTRERGSRYSPDPDRYRRGPDRERSPVRSSARYSSRERYREPYKYASRRDPRSPSPRRGNLRS